MPYDDIIEMWKGKGGSNPTPKPPSEFDDITKMWRSQPSPQSTVQQPVQQQPTSTPPLTPPPVAPPMPTGAPQQAETPFPSPPRGGLEGYASDAYFGIERLFKKGIPDAARDISNVPMNIARNTLQHATEGVKDVAEGFFGNEPIPTRVGKIGLGALAIPYSLISGPAAEFKKPVAGVAGERAANIAEFVATAGLPMRAGINKFNATLPSQRAQNTLFDVIGDNPAEIRAGVQQMMTNPRLSVMDVFSGARTTGQGLAVTVGPHQRSFDRFVTDRQSGTGASVRDAYDRAMGPPENVFNYLTGLKKRAQNVGETQINTVVERAGAVNVNPVIKYIDDIVKPGANQVLSTGANMLPPTEAAVKRIGDFRKFLTDDKTTRFDAKSLHEMQKAIRAEADNLSRSATGSDRQLGYELMKFRNKLVDAIDAATPRVKVTVNGKEVEIGAYRAGLNDYRTEKSIQDAFDRGATITRNTNSWEDHPDFVRAWFDGLSTAEKEAARLGGRMDFDRVIGRAGSNPRGLRGTEISTNPEFNYNLEKARIMYGDEQVSLMASRLQHERNIAQTNQDLTGGSQTAKRQAIQSAIPQRQHFEPSDRGKHIIPIAAIEAMQAGISHFATGSIIPGIGTAIYIGSNLAGRATGAVTRRIGNRLTDAHNTQLGEMLQSTAQSNPQLMQNLVSYANSLSTPRPSIANRLSRNVAPLLP